MGEFSAVISFDPIMLRGSYVSEQDYRGRKRARTEEWQCHICDAPFRTQSELRRHEKKHPVKEIKSHRHLEKLSSVMWCDGKKRWRCELCKSTLSNKANLKRHHETIHGINDVNIPCVEQATVTEVVESIMFVCECTAATAKIDCVIEHAQLHHLEGYKPILQGCDACNFTFEAQYFADHLPTHDENKQIKTVRYTPSKLIKSAWSDMFPKLPNADVNRIKSSSIYEHTRKVKMNCDKDSGKLLYQCDVCELFVCPKDVEGHCSNDCAQNPSTEHFCSDCEIFFYTSEALREHEGNHKEGLGVDSFRIATFNCKWDAPINDVLRRLQENSQTEEDTRGDATLRSVETQQSNRTNKRIEIIDDCLISRSCCGKFIPLSEFEAHKATHRVDNVAHENNEIIEEEMPREQNGVMPDSNNETVSLEQSCEMTDNGGVITDDNSSQRTFIVGRCELLQSKALLAGADEIYGIIEEKMSREQNGMMKIADDNSSHSTFEVFKSMDTVVHKNNEIIEEEMPQEQNGVMPDSNKKKVPLEQSCETTDNGGKVTDDNYSQCIYNNSCGFLQSKAPLDAADENNEIIEEKMSRDQNGVMKIADDNSSRTFEVSKSMDPVNQGNSPCGILQSNATLVGANMKRDATNGTNADSKIATLSRVSDNFSDVEMLWTDNFSEEMKNELRQELQNLIKENGSDTSEEDSADKQLNKEQECIISEDKLNGTDKNNVPNELQDVTAGPESHNFESDQTEALEKVTNNEERKSKEQLLIEEDRRIRALLCSRD